MRTARIAASERLAGLLERLAEPMEALGGRTALRRVMALSEHAWACDARVCFSAIGRVLSMVEGGQWFASATGLTWVLGRECCWLVAWPQVEAVQSARAVARLLGVPLRSWTLGGAARGLLQWTGVHARGYACTRAALGGTRWAYQQCEPGEWNDCELADLSAAYHQVVERLPSPKVDWLADGPCWEPLTGQQKERWESVVKLAGAHKGLRTRLLGCMIGGGRGVECWHKGQRLHLRAKPGPLPVAGLLVVRTVYELCALEARESHACYANTDCVIAAGGGRRCTWERYGYAYRVQARGDASVVSLGCYKVGTRQTRWYGAGGRYPVLYPADPLPARLTLPAWH